LHLGAERGLSVIDAYRAGTVIQSDQIPWEKYLNPADRERVIAAEALAERAKQEMLLGVDKEPGLELPWPKAKDRVFMRQGTLILWAGWSRHGKTRMLKQVMLHAIAKGERPLVASMEEDVRAVFKDIARMACCTQDPSPREIDQFIGFVRGNLWLYDQQGMVEPRKLLAVIRYAVAELKVTQVMVDSLMMLALGRDDYEGQARFLNELHTIAMNTGATIHLVAHMRKREGKSGEEIPGTIHDISGGHELGSIADSVFIVWRDMKEGASPSCAFRVDKQRGRIDWMGTLGFNFHQTARQFVEDVHPMRFWNDRGENF
jgi:KaiC/GvpD/RAD55 family RecA-like ATPase